MNTLNSSREGQSSLKDLQYKPFTASEVTDENRTQLDMFCGFQDCGNVLGKT